MHFFRTCMQWLPATALVLGALSQRHRNNVILARRFLTHSEQVLERCSVMIVCRFGSSVSPQAGDSALNVFASDVLSISASARSPPQVPICRLPKLPAARGIGTCRMTS